MKHIRKLSPNAVLFLISQLQNFREKHPKRKIYGNLPRNEESKTLLFESGFFDYAIPSHGVSLPKNKNILQMKRGIKVFSSIAGEVVEFAQSHLSLSDSFAIPVYESIVELMANTKQHAYIERVRYSPCWWVIAVYFPESNSVHFSFLDNGSGIPYTVKKGLRERISLKLSNRLPASLESSLLKYNDAELIESTLKGESRTRTGKKYRGRGLPGILEQFEEGSINNLKVLSGKGRFDCEGNQKEGLKRRFGGTLVSWDFRKPHGGTTHYVKN